MNKLHIRESLIHTSLVPRLLPRFCRIYCTKLKTGREPGRFDHVHYVVLCMVLCVVLIIELVKAGEEPGNEANAYNIMYENYNGIIFMQDVTTSTNVNFSLQCSARTKYLHM